MVQRNVFPMKPKINVIYPSEENTFMVPNHEKKGDYCVNEFLSMLFILMRKMSLWCPIIKRKDVTM